MRLNYVPNCADHMCLIFRLKDSSQIADDWTVWPLQVVGGVVGGELRWNIYAINRATDRGFHRRDQLTCSPHSRLMWYDWQDIAREEVTVYEQTCRYYDQGGR